MANIYLSGIAKWAKLQKPDEKFDFYGLDLYLDDASIEKFDKSGLQLTKKTNEDGIFITLKRKPAALIKGELVKFGAPQVLTADNAAFAGIVGNGSEVTCKVNVYDTAKGKGHRLEAVRVDNLIAVGGEDTDTPANGAPF